MKLQVFNGLKIVFQAKSKKKIPNPILQLKIIGSAMKIATHEMEEKTVETIEETLLSEKDTTMLDFLFGGINFYYAI